ncbi:outer membrane biogenesis protein BamB [Rosistilla carotiformis]|uniref:Outer membrane biogenesis protein BamB n=1 Tax=Rosistilla carotiformis TaxID=2528017 RepID=A0A518JWL7_9BACT|nr:PQQ-binding-like beta-propeller repeat protein [Rosistilla carotiformis]QDV69937.1 outer membrane biogenesis protein BamB [Rosistilla carotiformis]
MNFSYRNPVLPCLAFLLLTSIAHGDNPAVLSSHEATHLGLEQAWGKTLQAGSGVGRLVDIALHVDETRSQKFIDIFDGEKLVWRTPTDRLDPVSGKPIGEEAVRKAAERELLFLKARGIKGEIREKVIPQIWLYALGADGTVQALDAETGETVWVQRAGEPRQPKFSLGVDDRYVSFLSGATLVQLDALKGSIVNIEPCKTVPMGGATIVGDYVMNPSTVGIEGHWLDDITEPPYLSMTSGHAIAKPRRFPKSKRMAWPTSEGLVYCMEATGSPSELFRIQSAGNVNGRVEAVGEDLMFFSSAGGSVYAFKVARSATPLWQYSTGEPMVGDVIALDKNIYATSSYGNLYAFDASSGQLVWKTPASRIKEVIGSIGDALIARDSSNHLAIVNALNGSRAATAMSTILHRTIVNRGTDRVYLVSDTGYVQCLRPIGRELPELKIAVEFKPEAETEEPTKPAAPKTNNENPFGAPAAGADPFGAPAGGADPFGAPAGGADPFGAPAGGGMDNADPFGAANPF